MREKKIKAWHFFPNDRRMAHDGIGIDAGWIYSVDGKIELCRNGLHGSIRAIDALYYAPGNMVSRTLHWGDVQKENDKICSRHREVLWVADAEETLRAFARWCAIQVVDKWNVPDVVRQYLETGDESIRAAARDAAGAAAGDAAWDAAGDAAWSAARDAQNSKLEQMLMELEN